MNKKWELKPLYMDHTRRIRRLASRKRVPIGQAIELYRGRHGYHRPSQISDAERAAWAAKGYPKQQF